MFCFALADFFVGSAELQLIAGFINFIVAPSMEVCSDMLDKIVAPMEKLSRGTIDERGPQHTVLERVVSAATRGGEGAAGDGKEGKDTTNGCPAFSIDRPWDPHIASNRDTWKQKSLEGLITAHFEI